MWLSFQSWIATNPWIGLLVVLILGYALYRVTRWALARGLYYVAIRSETIYDDLIVDNLYPFRFAWLVPLALAYIYSYYAFGADHIVTNTLVFLSIIMVVDFTIVLLNAFNDLYEHRPTYTGSSIAAYVDIAKVLIIVGAILFTISIFSNVPPMILLGSLGAWLAVLLLIFRDTILNFLASIQITTQELVKDGDFIEVPNFNVNGTVTDVTLNSIKVKNTDNTTTVIPTYKIVDVAFKNYRGMEESGGRRIKASLVLDINSIKFCDLELLERLSRIDLIADVVSTNLTQIQQPDEPRDTKTGLPLDGPQITNAQLFMKYIEAYLKDRADIRKRHFPFVVRTLQPGAGGLPLELYVFTKKTSWTDYEATKDEIIIHLLVTAPYFDLKVS